jgi:hypothetical protein
VQELAAPQVRSLIPAFQAHRFLERASVERTGLGIDQHRIGVGEQRVTEDVAQLGERLP